MEFIIIFPTGNCYSLGFLLIFLYPFFQANQSVVSQQTRIYQLPSCKLTERCGKLWSFVDHFLGETISGWWFQPYPSEKYEFVSWDDDIPNIWENNPNVPNHQPDMKPLVFHIYVGLPHATGAPFWRRTVTLRAPCLCPAHHRPPPPHVSRDPPPTSGSSRLVVSSSMVLGAPMWYSKTSMDWFWGKFCRETPIENRWFPVKIFP